MSEMFQQIMSACVPVLCLLITAGGAYLVALMKRETAQIEQQIDNETASKYMDMAADAVTQAVTYVAQTFVDALKSSGGFTKEKQAEAFEKAKEAVLTILGDTIVEALGEIYGDFDAWLETKIEQVCRELKETTDTTAVSTAAATTASAAATIAATAVQQLTAETITPEETAE